MFDAAPVIAEVLHLLAHPEELRYEVLTHCGTCTGRGQIVNLNRADRRLVTCPACHGIGAR